MGLSIGYTLTAELSEAADVRELLDAVRGFALDLPLAHVGEIIEFAGDDPEPDDDHPDRWLRIQAEGYVEVEDRYYSVPPTHGYAFSTWPGEGCEPANFGFCTYPAFITVEGTQVAVKREGWTWTSSCKTQYAANPKSGGLRHFLRCHLGVVKILDFLCATGLARVKVFDDSEYWENRDLKLLEKKIREWNELIAGFAGAMRDSLETEVESPITDFPDFEHLEAKGLERLKKLRRGNN